MRGDEFAEELDAFGRIEIDYGDAVLTEPIDATREVARFADDDGTDAELADQSAAIPAGCERGDHNLVAPRAMTASFSEGVGFAVDGGVVLLDSAIMAAAEQLTIGVEDC